MEQGRLKHDIVLSLISTLWHASCRCPGHQTDDASMIDIHSAGPRAALRACVRACRASTGNQRTDQAQINDTIIQTLATARAYLSESA